MISADESDEGWTFLYLPMSEESEDDASPKNQTHLEHQNQNQKKSNTPVLDNFGRDSLRQQSATSSTQ